MADDIEAPNFSYAYEDSASWNPALRPNDASTETSDLRPQHSAYETLDRQPQLDPPLASTSADAQPAEVNDQHNQPPLESRPIAPLSASVPDLLPAEPGNLEEQKILVTSDTQDDGDTSGLLSRDAEQILPIEPADPGQETPPMIPQSGNVGGLDDRSVEPLDGYTSGDSIVSQEQTLISLSHSSAGTHLEQTSEEEVMDNYEYQADATEADLAIEEAPTASLLADEEPLPEADDIDPPVLSDSAVAPQNDELTVTLEPSGSDHPAMLEEPGPEQAFDWGGVQEEDEFTHSFGIQHSKAEMEEAFRGLNGIQDAPLTGAVAASQATALAQALAEHKDDEVPRAEIMDAITNLDDNQDNDMAALWKAALEGDEFLDEADGIDPSGFFADDDGGFLEDTGNAATQIQSPTMPVPVYNDAGQMQGFSTLGQLQDQAQANVAASSGDRYRPAPGVPQNQSRMPNANFFSSMDHSRSAATPSTEIPGMFGQNQYNASPQASLQRPPGPTSSGSFVDRSKAGYASPYDLPTDIVQPRKRPIPQRLPSSQSTAPPPRTSSIQSPTGPLPPPLARAASVFTPPGSATVAQGSFGSPTVPSSLARNAVGQSKDSAGFFADLPMASRPKPRPSGSYAPGQAATPGGSMAAPSPLQGPPSRPPSRTTIPFAVPPQTAPEAAGLGGFRQPERLPLLPDQPLTDSRARQSTISPPASTRYSPSTQPQQISTNGLSLMSPPQLPQTSRYSPAPNLPESTAATNRYAAASGVPPGAQKVQPFIPKTSSPLAYHGHPSEGNMQPPRGIRALDYASPPNVPQPATALGQVPARLATPPNATAYNPLLQSSPRSERAVGKYAPTGSQPSTMDSPPKRSQTQSPGMLMKGPKAVAPVSDRSYSTVGKAAQPGHFGRSVTQSIALPPRNRFSSDLSFAVPQDERSQDPLERWKGYPILNWSPSGALVTSFPNQVPFYAVGHGIPSIKCTPGTVSIQDTKTTFPLNDRQSKFPGPLPAKAKGKKKDVLAWMTGKIEDQEQAMAAGLLDLEQSVIFRQRAEEKVVLWKAVRLLLEHDNVLESKPGVNEAMRNILLPNHSSMQAAAPAVGSDGGSGLQVEQKNTEAYAEIKRQLIDGQRERAVWYAAEKHLWSHAMLIASTLGPNVWKQVIQEFVKSQVKDVGDHSESLAALYEVFAGNFEESIDELVPPSARAGLQMVSKVYTIGSSAKNPLDGLDQWRETLSLIISNRSTNDGQAIAALGRLLASYGRIEAAHTCFLFARSSIRFSGADDLESDVVLFGADHKSLEFSFGGDLDAIILTEIYEYAQSLNTIAGSSTILPHLQAFKLIHAYELAEHGMRSASQNYCDAIVNAIKSTTRGSPYYHPAFTTSLEDLTRCLSQAPQPASGAGWVSKLSSDKVSGSMWKRFNSFVAGEEGDAASTGSGQGQEGGNNAGPFGRVTGDTPSVSRTPSHTDLYGAMVVNGQSSAAPVGTPPTSYTPMGYGAMRPAPEQSAAGRYAPSSGAYAPNRSSLDSVRSSEPERATSIYAAAPNPSLQPNGPQRAISTPYGAHVPQVKRPVDSHQGAKLYAPRPDTNRAVSDYQVPYSQASSSRPTSSDNGQANYEPSVYIEHANEELVGQYDEITPAVEIQQKDRGLSSTFELASEPEVGQHGEHSTEYPPSASYYGSPASTYDPIPASYAPLEASYEPPSQEHVPAETQTHEMDQSSYQPSSYQPYEPNYQMDDEVDQAEKPKKKSFMDDDEDDGMTTRQDPGDKAATKAKADKEADDAFKKAAEADAARDSAEKEAAAKKGWFGGWFGKKDADVPTAVRAKLGEQSSFYFDKDLNKWVNKKGGAEAEKTAATAPPPPRGPMSRVASTAGGLPSGPPSRVASGVGLAGMAPGGAGSRPPTGGPGARAVAGPPGSGPPSRVGTPAGEEAGTSQTPPGPGGLVPPSRPSTGMSAASSIDDLLGPPQARKGGTIKGKKRGGRYVDVMAK